jgi:hypothetical protein
VQAELLSWSVRVTEHTVVVVGGSVVVVVGGTVVVGGSVVVVGGGSVATAMVVLGPQSLTGKDPSGPPNWQ